MLETQQSSITDHVILTSVAIGLIVNVAVITVEKQSSSGLLLVQNPNIVREYKIKTLPICRYDNQNNEIKKGFSRKGYISIPN